ncbi:protein SMAX1-LIKE 3-like [Salvia divinorum]|uniref:Protein SMAX1-LIKE 3-like n=1 Tax=Salvia divinorum TaxID=28513 RepID=A0ABD1ICL5_SALDI
MRAGGAQQALAAEAAGVVRQAVALAKRRGHAQVTPLHVATTMLAAPGGLFRVACQDSHSHPLQCKALELCFNVALNRLPASAPTPHPSISNALVAAFKRAQAHQRRGAATDSQPQQPLPAVRIEFDHLVVSILDDPSVSRVMREAGFSSTQVKINVEKSISSPSPSPSPKSKHAPTLTLSSSSPPSSSPPSSSKNEDVDAIIETLIKKNKRSVALVGESTSTLSAAVKALMRRIETGEAAEPLREVKFVSIPPLHTLLNLRRDEVEMKMSELTCLVQSLMRRGVVLYVGDLSDYLEREGSYHMIMEIGRLVWGIGEMERFWVMGIATFQTYMRCRDGCHSLQTVWGLHPLTIPADTLAFTLVSHSDEGSGETELSCCTECREKFRVESRELQASANELALSRLPSWLRDESRRLNDQEQKCETMRELCKKWNSFCNSNHNQPSSSSSSSPFSSGDAMETDIRQKFKEFNAENLNLLCNTLEEKVPSHKQIVPEIAGTILQCRSRMLKRKIQSGDDDVKEDTWLLFLGPDKNRAKEKIARELARIVFGSYSSLASIRLSSSPSKDDECRSYIDRFAAAVEADPRRVFLVEDLEQADYGSRMGIKRAMEKGRIGGEKGEEVGLGDAIVVLSCGGFGDDRREEEADGGGGGGGFLDLNMSCEEDGCVDDLGILGSVDRRVVFEI